MKRIEAVNDFVVKFANVNGSGSASANELFAKAILRMGVPVVLTCPGHAVLAVAVEELGNERLVAFRQLGAPELALTARRAETLKVPAYDGDIVRLVVPPEVDAGWLRALADPADDLRHPMKGPLPALRQGPADLHRAGAAFAQGGRLLVVGNMVERTLQSFRVSHGRLLAARKLGLTQIPTMVAKGWSEAQKKAYVIADNKLALNAGWDLELLAVELGDLQGFLDGIFVEFVHDSIGGLTVQRRIVGTKLLLGPGVGDLLDADCDLHGWPSLFLPLEVRYGERRGWSDIRDSWTSK